MKKVKKFFCSCKEILGSLRFLLSPIIQHGKVYFILNLMLVGILVYPTISVIQAFSVRIILNSLAEHRSFTETVLLALLLEGGLLVLGIADSIYREYYSNKMSLKISSITDKELFKKSLNTDYSKFDDPEYYNNYTYASNQYTSKTAEALSWLTNLLQSLVTALVLTVFLSSRDPFILCCVLFSLILSSLLSKKTIKTNEEVRCAHIPFNRTRLYVSRLFYLREFAAQQKSTRLSDFSFELYDNSTNSKLEIIDKYKGKKLEYSVIGGVIEGVYGFAISTYLIYSVSEGRITLGDFAGFLAAASILRRNISILFNAYNDAYSLHMYTERVRKFFDTPAEIEDTKGKIAVPDGAFRIDFNNVSFSYGSSDFAIRNLNLSIHNGEKVAIVGENGAGKTTITKLLLRLYDPSSGEILVNGTPIREYSPKELRLKMGVAFQEHYLYTMSYAKNLSLYHDMSDEEIERVSKQLGLDRVLAKNNASYNSQVGREFDGSGIQMSEGEQQKLALARVFSGNFGLLVLDEPTASLDPLAEYELNRLILDKASTTTTILISHRLSAVRDADRIILVENGQIAEEGTHDELIALHGKYYEMFEKQASGFRN